MSTPGHSQRCHRAHRREYVAPALQVAPVHADVGLRAHLGGLIDNLLLTAELEAMEQTRERLAAKRAEIALRAASAVR